MTAAEGRRRVALVAHDIHDQGGMERACAELIRNTHEEFSFVVIAADLAPDLRPLVSEWMRIPVPPRPFPLKFTSFFLLGGLALRRARVDLVHTVGAIVPNRVDVASVHFCHAGYRATVGSLAPRDAPLVRRANTGVARRLALMTERWCYRPGRVTALAAVSDGVALELGSAYPGVPVARTPNGVDTQRFRPSPNARAEVRAEQGIGPEQCVALFAGGDWDRKGLALAVEAIAKARAEGADLVLWVVGTGDRDRFKGLAARAGVGVTFFGRRSDLERFYQAADLFLLPSAYETFGLVCFEAAACGLPLVIPRIHGASELIGAEELVERDAGSIAAALVELARDPIERAARGAEARRRAMVFTWSASSDSVADLYRSLPTRRPR